MSAILAPRQDFEFPYKELGIATTGYKPRKQFIPFHNRSSRWTAMVCHRRAGKTVACVNELVTRAMYTQKKDARYAYVAPFYRQAKDVAWQYLKEATAQFAVDTRESELRVILPNGAWITLYGADNIDALRGLYLDGVVIDEYGDCRPGLWGQVVLPTLADRRGWAVFIGTPKGNNHFKKQYDKILKEGGFTMLMKASVSGLLHPEELVEMRKQMSDEEWEQEMECSFQAALLGAYYGDLIAKLENVGRIKSVPVDHSQKVFVATDLGFTDSTAFWFWQVRPDGIAVVDYYENHSKDLDHYFEYLETRGYEYDTIWLPHDARAKTLQTGVSTVQQFVDRYKDKCTVRIAPKLAVQDGVNASRRILPACSFDAVNCYDGLEALKSYRREFDTLKQSFSNSPRHDWSSHGADAFRMLALVTGKPIMQAGEIELPAPKPLVKSMSDFTLDELFKMNEAPKLRLVSRRRV